MYEQLLGATTDLLGVAFLANPSTQLTSSSLLGIKEKHIDNMVHTNNPIGR